MYSLFVTMVERFDITRQYFDHESSCTVLGCVMRAPAVSIATIEWVLSQAFQQFVEYLYPVQHHTLWGPWQKVMQAQGKKNAIKEQEKFLPKSIMK